MNHDSNSLRRIRVQPPAAGFAAPLALYRTLMAARGNGGFHRAMRSEIRKSLGYTTHKVLETGSGKYALLELLRMWGSEKKRPVLGLAAYTCPDVAAAAFRAGWQVQPLDINPLTLEIETSNLEQQHFDAVLLSNLYGLPDNITFWESTGRRVIDDASQAALSFDNDRPVGTRSSAGIISFGRGKALCGIGGGMLLLAENETHGIDVDDLDDDMSGDAEALRDMALGIACWLFQRPMLYGIPARLPSLNLGATRCNFDFGLEPPRLLQFLHGAAQARAADKTRKILQRHAERLDNMLVQANVVRPLSERAIPKDQVTLIRYPILMPDQRAKRGCLKELQRRGLGASPSYPFTLSGYAEFCGIILPAMDRNARSVAQRIITLPIHQFVTAKDHSTISKIVTSWS